MLRAPSSVAARSRRSGLRAGEDDVGALGARPPGGLEADAGAAADHDDGLPEQLLALTSHPAADPTPVAAISARSALSAST